MIKRQNRKSNLFIIFLILFITFSFSAFCNTANEKLMLADSLFAQKKYTQSFELYEDIQRSDNKATPAMLLKMAFIKEGLGDFTNALYYLNLYYLKTYNKRVLKKMENLADQNQLAGYNYDDAEFFLNLYHQYQLQVDLLISSLILLYFAFLIYRIKTNKMPSKLPQLVFVCFLIGLFLINNFGREKPKAIVIAGSTYLMQGPSPGADVVDVIGKGHRVEILGKDDVWTKIAWNDQVAYIKEINLRSVNL